jgi:hypothetical protein
MVTTDGMTLFATEVTSHALTWPELDVAAGAGDAEDFVAAMMAPPATPPDHQRGDQRRREQPRVPVLPVL